MKKTLSALAERYDQRRLPYEFLLVFCAMAAGLSLPFVNYTYNGEIYHLSGIRLLSGLTIAGGTIRIAASPILIGAPLCALLAAVGCFLLFRKNRIGAGLVVVILSAAAAGLAVLYSMRVEGILSTAGAKRVGVETGYLMIVLAACLGVSDGLQMIGSVGALPSSCDIAAYAFAVIGSMAVPFAEYTYKKVSHPFTGFDMLTTKEVAGEVFSKTSVLPWIVIILSILVAVLSLLPIRKVRRKAEGILLMSAAIILCAILMTTSATDLLNGAKDAARTSWSLVTIVLGAILMGRALYMLYLERVVSALDFMTVPGLIYLLINNYLPMIGISMAFKKIDYSVGIWKSPWVGFDNFKYLFSTDTAWIITRNTILYNFAFIVLGIFTGMVVGICLASVIHKAVQTFYQTTILLPQLISMIVVAYIVFAFFSNEAGFVNKTLLKGQNEINFYGERKVWPFLLVFLNNWKQIGYNSVIFLSSIVGIDRGLYEAAMVDGCSRWKQITKITIPQLKPTIITLFLLQVGRVFYSDFGLFYQVPLDSGTLYPVTNTIDTYVYRSLMVLNNLSSASAASAFQSVCGFALVLFANYIVRRADRENALF